MCPGLRGSERFGLTDRSPEKQRGCDELGRSHDPEPPVNHAGLLLLGALGERQHLPRLGRSFGDAIVVKDLDQR